MSPEEIQRAQQTSANIVVSLSAHKRVGVSLSMCQHHSSNREMRSPPWNSESLTLIITEPSVWACRTAIAAALLMFEVWKVRRVNADVCGSGLRGLLRDAENKSEKDTESRERLGEKERDSYVVCVFTSLKVADGDLSLGFSLSSPTHFLCLSLCLIQRGWLAL